MKYNYIQKMRKSISVLITFFILHSSFFFLTSCEDMFTAENKLVTTDLAPKDTLYQMMGILQNMQKVADRSIILGEVRADLVQLNTVSASMDLQELAQNATTTSNAYNDPTDYYAVINSCNIFLANVDSTLRSMGESYYEREIIAAKCFRAWTYLELAKIYGKVPFVTTPVITASEADDIVTKFNNTSTGAGDMVSITTFCINDLLQYASRDRNAGLLPSYGSGSSYMRHFFIPVRLMLAELYLYRGSFTQNQADFVEAVRYYHDYLAFPNEEITTGDRTVEWNNNSFSYVNSNYDMRFSGIPNGVSTNDDYLVYVPMDTIAYYGTTSSVRSLFNAQYSNNYYAPIIPSTHISEISQAQDNCVFVYNSATDFEVVIAPKDEAAYGDFDYPYLYIGDLRLQSVFNTESYTDLYHGEYSKTRQYNMKYTEGSSMLLTDRRQNFVGLYRRPIVYLHLAEALNGAGFPETAFCILKYGLSESSLRKYVSEKELTGLAAITSRGFSGEFANAAGWDEDIFHTRDQFDLNNTTAAGNIRLNQYGIHSLGSGDTWINPFYELPTDVSGLLPEPEFDAQLPENATHEDSLAYQQAVDIYNVTLEAVTKHNKEWLESDEVRVKRQAALALMILEEEALEGSFEGTRFYDLMRYSKWSGNTAFLGNTVAQRNGSANIDASLMGKLASEAGWYLPLKKR